MKFLSKDGEILEIAHRGKSKSGTEYALVRSSRTARQCRAVNLETLDVLPGWYVALGKKFRRVA